MNPLILGLALTVAAPALKDTPKEMPTIVGEWVAEKLTHGGQDDMKPEALHYTFTADGNWIATRDGKQFNGKNGGYKLDPKGRPATVDLSVDRARADSYQLLGIYRLNGDTLTICVALETKPRPTEFESPDTSAISLIVFKRVK